MTNSGTLVCGAAYGAGAGDDKPKVGSLLIVPLLTGYLKFSKVVGGGAAKVAVVAEETVGAARAGTTRAGVA